MKLPNFPVAQWGELLSSVVARCLTRSSGHKTRYLKLLGLHVAAASSLVPRDLRPLAAIMPSQHPWADAPERIVLGHTLVPLVLHFAEPGRRAATLARIVSGQSKNPSATLGLTVALSGDPGHATKWCPACVTRDIRTHGFPILYRQHQPLFVRFCAEHAEPLHWSCLNCQGPRKAADLWLMAGRCHCDHPHTPPVFEVGLDNKAKDGWLWLSQQVASILSAEGTFPDRHVAGNLFTALEEQFAATRGGLDANRIAEALVDQFGEPILRELGVGSWCEPPPVRRRPSRVLSRAVIHGNRIPNVLHVLLLARLVINDVSALWRNMEAAPRAVSARLPEGYGRRGATSRDILGKAAIEFALAATEGQITAAARSLGVHSYVLAADMRHHRMRLPLAAVTIRRLGNERIEAVRQALQEGMPKNKIQLKFGISEWSIVLIELDSPDLSDVHRRATVARQRREHREVLLGFRRKNPSASRNAFAVQNTGTLDWLRKYDRVWLETRLPKPNRGSRKKARKARKNWTQVDQMAAAAVRDVARKELVKSDRPTRLTRTRLLSVAGALAAMDRRANDRYPRTHAEADILAESKAQFVKRTIRWALKKYAGQHAAISTNRLRRVAGLSASRLIEYRDYVIEVAITLALPFDARCALSPWRDVPSR